MEQDARGRGNVKYKGKDLGLRCLVCVAGLFIMALGVNFTVRANLGTAPVSSLPYVLSLYFPLSLGACSALVNSALILLQIILLRRRYELFQLFQFAISFLFGVFVDAAALLIPWVNPTSYPMQWVCSLVGCLLVGISVSMLVQADIVMMPGEGVVKALVTITGGEFGKLKTIVDVSIVAVASGLSLLLFHELRGVREGTLAAALLIGLIVRFINKRVTLFKQPDPPTQKTKTGEEEA